MPIRPWVEKPRIPRTRGHAPADRSEGMMLRDAFFDREPEIVAQALVGKVIRRRYEGRWLSAAIVEAEAYLLTEKGSHASLGRTPSREALFMPAGTIYMYYARGGDSLNVSCRGAGNAVLFKSGVPVVDEVSARRRPSRHAPPQPGLVEAASRPPIMQRADAPVPFARPEGARLEWPALRPPPPLPRGRRLSTERTGAGPSPRHSDRPRRTPAASVRRCGSSPQRDQESADRARRRLGAPTSRVGFEPVAARSLGARPAMRAHRNGSSATAVCGTSGGIWRLR